MFLCFLWSSWPSGPGQGDFMSPQPSAPRPKWPWAASSPALVSTMRRCTRTSTLYAGGQHLPLLEMHMNRKLRCPVKYSPALSIELVVFDATNNQIHSSIMNLSYQARKASHSVREDCVWSPGWPGRAGDRSRPHLSAPASRPRGHAGCYGSDGHASVHQQWSAQGSGPLHHPLWPSDWGSDWRSSGPAEG